MLASGIPGAAELLGLCWYSGEGQSGDGWLHSLAAAPPGPYASPHLLSQGPALLA